MIKLPEPARTSASNRPFGASLVMLALGLAAATAADAAEGVLVNARIHTLDNAHPVAEALAWDRQGRIIAVGPRSEVTAKSGGAPVHDAKGAVVVPGLIDAHAHLMGLGYALMRADLVGARRPCRSHCASAGVR